MFSLGRIFLLLLVMAVSLHNGIYSQSAAHSRVRVFAAPADYQRLAAAGLPMDHFHQESRSAFVGEFSAYEIAAIEALGMRFEIIQDNLEAWYTARNLEDTPQKIANAMQNGPIGFHLGSMGGFLTFNELADELDSMYANYPQLITPKSSIGLSVEGKPIWMVKISDNPSVDESEPEVLFTGLHHAREPISMMQMVYFMHHILENYGIDSSVTYMVNNRELYFVPVVNPDGYLFNEFTNPAGGGMWRKNRRDNGGGVFGVDLNRNYGYEWAHDNIGSSPDSASNTYRGTSPFSEPESRAIRDFCIAHPLAAGLNYHAYGNFFIYPWGFQSSVPSADVALFYDFSASLTAENGYLPGTPSETVGYMVNGGSDDWMYGEQTVKDKIYAFTPEAGSSSDGFWPQSTRIPQICSEQVNSNLEIACLAGDCIDTEPSVNEEFEAAVVWFPVKFSNRGLSIAKPFSAQFSSADPNIVQILAPTRNIGGLQPRTAHQDSFGLVMATNIPPGTWVRGLIHTFLSGGVVLEDSVAFIYGIPDEVFADSLELGPSLWVGDWALTTEKAHSGTNSMTDSPYLPYGLSTVTSHSTVAPVNLSNYQFPQLRFWAQWQLERGSDYVQLLASTDGVNFVPLRADHTRMSTGGFQPVAEPVYDGVQYDWIAERADLSAYAGQQVYIRFELHSDGWQVHDGFYFDDVVVTGYRLPSSTEVSDVLSRAILVPNPANGLVSARNLAQETEFSLLVYSLFGQELIRMQVASGAQIDISHLAAGIYFYRFESAAARGAIRKLIVK